MFFRVPRLPTPVRFRSLALLSVFLLLAGCAPAGPLQPGIDPNDLEDFADRFFIPRMQQLHIPGLVFVTVHDGEILLAKGYGQACIEEDRSVRPEDTVFRIGSISKPFVALATMQLVELGRLDLAADVNDYLTNFQIENPFSRPVTLEHLLTHTSGLQDPPYETVTDPSARQPLGQFLERDLPGVTTMPGEEFAYSSYGYALAAYLVEQISGLPFDSYVEQNICQPLGMHDTRYLLTTSAPAEMAMGYAYQNRGYEPQPLDFDDDYPGGSIISTGQDMAILISVLLSDGCHREACILRPDTLADLQSARVPVGSGDLQQTLGFVRGQVAGQRVLGHTGAIRGFGSSLDLFPDQGLGYFLSFNAECYGSSACDIISEFRREFVKRYLS